MPFVLLKVFCVCACVFLHGMIFISDCLGMNILPCEYRIAVLPSLSMMSLGFKAFSNAMVTVNQL